MEGRSKKYLTIKTLRRATFKGFIVLILLMDPGGKSYAEETSASSHISGSAQLCNIIGLDIAAADSALVSAASAAVNAGGNDTQVLAGSNARYGGAFKAVEDDAVTISDAFHQGLDRITDATIAVDALTLPEEKTFALSSIQSYSEALNFVNRFGTLALQYERTVNNRNKNLAMANYNESLGNNARNSSTSSTNGNANCNGNSNNYGGSGYGTYNANCNGNSTTTTTYDNAASVDFQAAANDMNAARSQQSSISQFTSTISSDTETIDNMQYTFRVKKAQWTSACPSLSF
jgi:hypothetical protein